MGLNFFTVTSVQVCVCITSELTLPSDLHYRVNYGFVKCHANLKVFGLQHFKPQYPHTNSPA